MPLKFICNSLSEDIIGILKLAEPWHVITLNYVFWNEVIRLAKKRMDVLCPRNITIKNENLNH